MLNDDQIKNLKNGMKLISDNKTYFYEGGHSRGDHEIHVLYGPIHINPSFKTVTRKELRYGFDPIYIKREVDREMIERAWLKSTDCVDARGMYKLIEELGL